MRRALLAVALVLLFAAPANAINFTVTGTPPHRIAQMEAAITDVVNGAFRQHWATATPLNFGPGGTPIRFEPPAQVAADCGVGVGVYDGCHGIGANGQPFIAINASAALVSYVLSHEILEQEADPTGGLYWGSQIVEVCDPVSTWFSVRGWAIADFVYPRYFLAGTAGPWDYLQLQQVGVRGVRRAHFAHLQSPKPAVRFERTTPSLQEKFRR